MMASLVMLIVCSGLISGSEAAYFSFTPSQLEQLKERGEATDLRIIANLSNSSKLLATILIANNFVNVSIVMMSATLSTAAIDFGTSTALKFIFETIVITTIILFFGEILPKILSSQHKMSFAAVMASPLAFLSTILSPLSRMLMKSTSVVNNRLAKHERNMSLDDLSQALELTSNDIGDEKEMLEGIVKFANLTAVDIMTPRLDVVSLDIDTDYDRVLQTVIDSGNSRIPIFDERPDEIKGILFVKDLLPHLDKKDFDWRGVLRKAYYIPETKRINDLLSEFQSNKTHMAIVVDEYGGMSGIVTLEDILEEIVGDINDELDQEERMWHRQSDGSIVFEAKISLYDFFKVTGIDEAEFDKARGEAETLAGFLLEINGLIPKKQDVIKFGGYKFVVTSADVRKIKKVHFFALPAGKKKQE